MLSDVEDGEPTWENPGQDGIDNSTLRQSTEEWNS